MSPSDAARDLAAKALTETPEDTAPHGLGADANPSDADEWTIVRLLHESSRAFRRAFERRARARALGHTRAQWWVLMRLSYCEGIRQVTLAQMLDIPPIALVRLIDRLEEAGLVERRVDPTDRRARTLHLTPAAHPQIECLRAIAQDVRDAAVSRLDHRERAELARLLGCLQGQLGRLDLVPDEETGSFDEDSDVGSRRGADTKPR